MYMEYNNPWWRHTNIYSTSKEEGTVRTRDVSSDHLCSLVSGEHAPIVY